MDIILLPYCITLTHSESQRIIFLDLFILKKTSIWSWIVGLIIGQDDGGEYPPGLGLEPDQYHIFGADARIRISLFKIQIFKFN